MTHGTMAVICKFDTIASDRALGHLHQAGNTWVASTIQCGSGSTWTNHDGATASDSGISISTGIWYCAVVRKASGTQFPRYSVYNYNTGLDACARWKPTGQPLRAGCERGYPILVPRQRERHLR